MMLDCLLWWMGILTSGFILWWNWWLVKLSASLFKQTYVTGPIKAAPRAGSQAVDPTGNTDKIQLVGRKGNAELSNCVTTLKAEYEGKLANVEEACRKEVADIKQRCCEQVTAMVRQHEDGQRQQQQVYLVKWQKCVKAAEHGAVAARDAGYQQGYTAGYEAGLAQGKAASNPTAALTSSLGQSPPAVPDVPQQPSTKAIVTARESDSNSGNSSGDLARSVCSEGSMQLAVGEEAVQPASTSGHRDSTERVQQNTASIPIPVTLLSACKAAGTAAPAATVSLGGPASEDAICVVSVIAAGGKAHTSAVVQQVAVEQAADSAAGMQEGARADSKSFGWQCAPGSPSNQTGGRLFGGSSHSGVSAQGGAGLFGSTNSIGSAGRSLGEYRTAAWVTNALRDSQQPASSAPALSCPGLFAAGDRQHSIWGPQQPAGACWTASGLDSKGALGAIAAQACEPGAQDTVQQGSSVHCLGLSAGSGMQHTLWGPSSAQSAGAGLAGFVLASGSAVGWADGQH